MKIFMSSEAQTNCGMDKQTKWVIKQMFSYRNKEKKERKFKNKVMTFEEGPLGICLDIFLMHKPCFILIIK